MRVLAFDCAGAQCAAAILADGRLLAARRIEAARGHAQLLVPMLVDLLAEAGLGFADIDRFAATTGPGSFTGIRVALATAHGLALGTGKPIIGIGVFDAIAAGAAETGIGTQRLLVAIDSRRAELFLQLFDSAGNALGDPAMLAPDAVADWAVADWAVTDRAGAGSLSLAGDAAHLVAPHLGQPVDPRWIVQADPAIVARLAADRPAGAAPSPFYLRPPDAAPARRS
jgi:tRNA threonylcarbamoyladenosine biosynthesis protein TsaB